MIKDYEGLELFTIINPILGGGVVNHTLLEGFEGLVN